MLWELLLSTLKNSIFNVNFLSICKLPLIDLCEQCSLGPPFFLFLMHQGMIWYDMTERVKNLGENKTLGFFLKHQTLAINRNSNCSKTCFRTAKKWTFGEKKYFSLLFARWTQMQTVGGWQLDTCLLNLEPKKSTIHRARKHHWNKKCYAKKEQPLKNRFSEFSK